MGLDCSRGLAARFYAASGWANAAPASGSDPKNSFYRFYRFIVFRRFHRYYHIGDELLM
jgi:hypothetical protein